MTPRGLNFKQVARSVSEHEFLRLLGITGGPRLDGKYQCPNPAHDDSEPSFSVFKKKGSDHFAGHCHGGCGLDGDIINCYATVHGTSKSEAAKAIGGFDPGNRMQSDSSDADDLDRERKKRQKRKSKKLGTIVAEYEYLNAEGEVAFTKRRYEPKDFRVVPYGSAYDLLYRLPELIEAIALEKEIWVVEGEKDVHSMEAHGLVATTVHSSSGWHKEHVDQLEGATLVNVLADDDEAGAKSGDRAVELLEAAGIDVRRWTTRGGKDATDHFEAGHRVDDFVEVTTTFVDKDEPTVDELLDEVLVDIGYYKDRPHLLDPPEPLVEGLVYEGYSHLISGLAKAGKSTFLGHMVSCMVTGEPFVGRWTRKCKVTWLGPDEGAPTTTGRFYDLGVTEGIGVIRLEKEMDRPRLLQLIEMICSSDRHRPDVLVLDSLTNYFMEHPDAPNENSASEVRLALHELLSVLRASGVTLLMIHHSAKGTQGARGSGDIEARPDVLLNFMIPGDAAQRMTNDERVINGVGRRGADIDPIICRMNEVTKRYYDPGVSSLELARKKDASLRDRVIECMLSWDEEQTLPAITKTALSHAVNANKGDVIEIVNELIEQGVVVDMATAKNRSDLRINPASLNPVEEDIQIDALGDENDE